jgi:hypothetical protein
LDGQLLLVMVLLTAESFVAIGDGVVQPAAMLERKMSTSLFVSVFFVTEMPVVYAPP